MTPVCEKCGQERREGSYFCGKCGHLFVGNGTVKISYGGVTGKAKVTFGQEQAAPKKTASKKKGSTTAGTPVLDTYTLEDLEGLVDAMAAAVGEFVKRSGKTHVFFGSYPQSLKAPNVQILSSQPNGQGYYQGSDGCLYAKVVANPFQNDYKFANGTKIQRGKVYYFKVEPIKWRILQEKDHRAFILAEQILTCQKYADANNDYSSSFIRKWLNADFVLQAFDEYERALICETYCSNDVASTGYDTNPYVCSPTKDFVFLPSIQELMTKKYGFETGSKVDDPARRKITTDYARAMGVGVSDRYPGTYHWWARSPAAFSYRYARPVESTGALNLSRTITDREMGVVPALRVSIGK